MRCRARLRFPVGLCGAFARANPDVPRTTSPQGLLSVRARPQLPTAASLAGASSRRCRSSPSETDTSGRKARKGRSHAICHKMHGGWGTGRVLHHRKRSRGRARRTWTSCARACSPARRKSWRASSRTSRRCRPAGHLKQVQQQIKEVSAACESDVEKFCWEAPIGKGGLASCLRSTRRSSRLTARTRSRRRRRNPDDRAPGPRVLPRSSRGSHQTQKDERGGVHGAGAPVRVQADLREP